MPSLSSAIMGLIAVASFDGDATTPAYRMSRGFTSAITRTGAGDYTLTLTDGVNAQTQALVQATSAHNAFACISVEFLTTTTLRIRTAVLAATPSVTATDIDFWIQVQEIGPA